MGRRTRKTVERNRTILSAFEAGRSVAQLSRQFDLTEGTVREIIRQEAHRRAVITDAYYRGFREEP
jgi:Mor family transcriptional regulator